MNTRREFLKVAGAAGVAGISTRLFAGSGGGVTERPNIVFIFSDDHASAAISAYKSILAKVLPTPNLDRIAKEGMRFDRCYVTNSICAPSRAVIQTGKHSHLNGVRTNGPTFDGSQQTFPKLLRAAGYETALIGKWHLKSVPQGFNYSEVLKGQGPYYNPEMFIGTEKRKHIGYTTDIITDLGLNWLKNKRDKSKPFMVMIQNKAPHRDWKPALRHINMFDDIKVPEPDNLFDDYKGRTKAARNQTLSIAKDMNKGDLKLTGPWGLTKEQTDEWHSKYGPKNKAFEEANLQGDDLVRWKYQRYIKDYLRCIKAVDENVGRVLDYLDESGLAKNTVVIYNSDQGFFLGEHCWFDKRFMYEETYGTPLMARWPGVIKSGKVSKDLVQNLDLAQTFLDIAGVKQPVDMQGMSLKPLMVGDTPDDWRKSLYYHYYEWPGAHMVLRHEGVSTKQYKLMHFYDVDEWEFFDLKKDPREMKSEYANAKYKGKIAELKKELKRLKVLYKVPAKEPLPKRGLDNLKKLR